MYEELSETMDSKSAKKIVEIMGKMYEDLQNTVTKVEFKELKDEFGELKNVVKELSGTVRELAVAQQRTEKRVEELAVAQQRTEKRVEELAVAQKELVVAQKKTELNVQELVKQQDFTNKHLSGLGFILENEAYVFLPELIRRDLGITLKENLCRKYLRDKKGSSIEVNITGRGTRDNEDIIIIGESKNYLSEKLIDEFIRKKLKRFEGVFKETITPVIITHMISGPDVEEYALHKGIKIYYSYEFNEQKYGIRLKTSL